MAHPATRWMNTIAVCLSLGSVMFGVERAFAQPIATAITSSTIAQQPTSGSADRTRRAIMSLFEEIDRLDAQTDSVKQAALLETAKEQVRELRTEAPGDPWLYYFQGRIDLSLDIKGNAADQLMKFVDTRPGRNDWRAHELLGDLFVNQFPRIAISHYDKADNLNPGVASVLYGQSLCAVKIGDRKTAVDKAQQAAAADGRKTGLYLAHLAALYRVTQRWDEAIREAQAALQLAKTKMLQDPSSKAVLMEVNQRYDLWIEVLEAYRRDRSQPTTDHLLRWVDAHMQRARFAERVAAHRVLEIIEEELSELKAGDGPPVELLIRYGELLVVAGRSREALEAFRSLLERTPPSDLAAEWVNRLEGP